ncbi:MAG TPA: TolC family protein [Vicinamibacterales bacterium]|nr:TolC family protein [Vicinamibacterales bacterium]
MLITLRPFRFTPAAVILPVLLAVPAAAQVGVGNLTLQMAMERAMAANATIAAARLRGPINLANLAVARERLNPEGSFELEKETPKEAYGFALPLELGGKRARRIDVAEATIRAGDAELAAVITQVRNDVRRAYFAQVLAESRLLLLREQRDLSTRARDTAQARFDAGSAPRLEVMQAQLALAATENEATAAEGTAAAARAALNALLAQPLDTTTALSTDVDTAPPGTPAALMLAQTASTELLSLDRQIEAQRARVALAESLRVPDVTPTFTLTHRAEPEFTYGWRAGAAITLPLFTSHRAGVLVEQTTLEQLILQRQATLLRIQGDVTAASQRAQAQRELFVRYRDQIIPQAQAVEQLAQDSYQLGQTGIAALLQALQATRDVRLRSLDAIDQFQTALSDLERAIGAPLP